MKSKIAICTLDNNNLGNRLQNYATQKYFQSLGYASVTLPDDRKMYSGRSIAARFKRLIRNGLVYLGYRREYFKKAWDRTEYIDTFTKQYIALSRPIDYRHLPPDLYKEFDYFVTGGDQVWHCWKNDRRELEYYFLKFAKPAQRISMAPSFGFETFPKKFIHTYKTGLEGFHYISVREKSGAELIKKLTGQGAIVLLDPTMLIDESEWLKILKKPPQYINDKYIFVYALGGFKGEMRKSTEHLAHELNCTIVDILDMNSDYYTHTRPDEFLYWIYNARLVVTDSFHAAVFSILFKRPFVVSGRDDAKEMVGRIDTLLNKFGLENRRYEIQRKSFFDTSARDELFSVHYDDVPGILEEERKKAFNFFQMCFSEHEK